MRVLLVKMSSMGDVFHTIPALSDALQNVPGITVDWVVEKSFADIAGWHPVVDKVFPIELRAWRQSPFAKQTRQQIKAFFAEINQSSYDLIIDAQGLLKSAWVTRKVKSKAAGYDWYSAREPLATLFYQAKYPVSKDLHAILRIRKLFAQALGYELNDDAPISYGLDTEDWLKPQSVVEQFEEHSYWVFLHGTTWETKYWPEDYWLALLERAQQQGVKVILPWGNLEEQERALRLQRQAHQVAADKFIWVPSQMLSLDDMAKTLKNAQAVVSVDTGLSHVSASLEVPMVVLYRVTDPKLVGADGPRVKRLVSPCAPGYIKEFSGNQQLESLQGLDVESVFFELEKLIRLPG